MTGADILKSPMRVNERSRTVYFFDGYVAVEIISGTEEQQRAVLALVGRAQAAFSLLAEVREAIFKPSSIDSARDMHERITAVLRDAGVLSGTAVQSEGT